METKAGKGREVTTDRPLFFRSLGISLILHSFVGVALWQVQIPRSDLQDLNPLMVRLLPEDEIPRFIDQPDAPPAEGPVQSRDISQVTSRATGPGERRGSVTTPESTGRPHLPKPPRASQPKPAPSSPPAAKANPASPQPSKRTEQAEPLGFLSEVEGFPGMTINQPSLEGRGGSEAKRPRPSLREQIALLGRQDTSGTGRAFDAGVRGETGTGERTVTLETQSSEFAPYLSEVKRRIESRWEIPPYAREVGLTGKLVLVFTITREGNVSKLEITKTSGVSILDQAAAHAVRDAAPYAPFPQGFTFQYLNVIASFEYVTSMIRSREPR